MVNARTILIVDDESLPRTLLSTSLKEAGYAVFEADSGKAALLKLRERPFDIVLLDLVMPEMDGFQVLKKMKSDNLLRNIPVVVVSASDDMESVVRSIEMGAVDHLSKPFDPILLHARVRAALAIHQQMKEGKALISTVDKAEEKKGDLRPQEQEVPEEEEIEEVMGIFGFLRSILKWGSPYKRLTAFFTLLVLVSLGLEAALPLGFKFITDDALIPHNFQVLVLTLVILIVALLVSTLIQIFSDYLYSGLATKVLNDIRFKMYRHLQRLSMGFYTRTPAGEITSRFTTDLSAVENTVMLTLPLAMCEFVFVAFSLGLMFVLEWKLAIFSVIGLFLSYKAEQHIEEPASNIDSLMKDRQAKITSVLQETVNAQPVVKILRLQSMIIERFKHQMIEFYRTAARAAFLAFLTERVPDRCMALFGLITISAGAFLTYYGFLSIGELISFQILLTGLVSSVGELTWSAPHLVRAASGMRRIEQLLNEKPDVSDKEGAVTLPSPAREIALSNVTFGYTEGQTNLKNVSLRIPVSESVLFVGPSGCGKSTVLNLLMRFYDPRQGFVAIDGNELRGVLQDSLRQHMSVVLQESFLFNTSIRENIRMGKREATDEEVEEAAKKAEIHEIIMNFPEGYDMMVGEKGGRLSGGQRQRVSLARAILSDPKILLLDEATSALDPVTEASINKTLEQIAKGRTVISVTHRLESAPNTDGIYVFKDGQLIESGPHEELLKRGGLYTQLWNKQKGFVIQENGNHAEATPERLRAIPILSILDEESIEAIVELFSTEHYPQDRIIVHEGDPGDRFYIIVRGRLEVFQNRPSGAESRVAVLEDGDYFGEIALVRNVPRTASVRTLSDCILLSLAGEQFLRLIEQSPKMRDEIERAILDRVSDPHNNIAEVH
jgi:ATP-binding cassette subfamily B protein